MHKFRTFNKRKLLAVFIIISILINLIGGFMPSLLASKKDPIKAINNN